MEWVEFSAGTVAEARDRALDELGVDEADAEFEVLEEPRAGLFGRTRGVARVRARVLPRAPRPKQERPRKRSTGGGAKRRTRSGGTATPAPDQVEEHEAAGPTGSESGDGSAERESERRSSRSEPGARRQEREMMEAAEQQDVAERFIAGLSEAIGLETSVSAELTEDNDLRVDIDGSEVGLFIGPGMRTLDALQEITRHVVQREAGDREYGRVVVDVAGVRATRRTALEAFVRATAERAVESGSSIPFEPMSSPDRKVVHDTIASIDGVTSTSEGEEPNRRVVVRPA